LPARVFLGRRTDVQRATLQLVDVSDVPERWRSPDREHPAAVSQARRVDEMQAVADALSLLANIVMAWNTTQMQAVLDR
jgi:hypothetical protein